MQVKVTHNSSTSEITTGKLSIACLIGVYSLCYPNIWTQLQLTVWLHKFFHVLHIHSFQKGWIHASNINQCHKSLKTITTANLRLGAAVAQLVEQAIYYLESLWFIPRFLQFTLDNILNLLKWDVSIRVWVSVYETDKKCLKCIE